MSARRVEINLSDGHGVILVDGQRVGGVRDLTLSAPFGEAPQLTLDVITHDVSTVAEAEVWVPADTAATLVALGWTPPDGQEVEE